MKLKSLVNYLRSYKRRHGNHQHRPTFCINGILIRTEEHIYVERLSDYPETEDPDMIPFENYDIDEHLGEILLSSNLYARVYEDEFIPVTSIEVLHKDSSFETKLAVHKVFDALDCLTVLEAGPGQYPNIDVLKICECTNRNIYQNVFWTACRLGCSPDLIPQDALDLFRIRKGKTGEMILPDGTSFMLYSKDGYPSIKDGWVQVSE